MKNSVNYKLTTTISQVPQVTGSYAVRGSVASQINQVVYPGAKQVSISASEYDMLQQKAAEYDVLVAKVALLEAKNQELWTQAQRSQINPDNNFLVDNSWIHALAEREKGLLDPKVMEAVGKLLKLKGNFTYPKERGRAAKGPQVWLKETFVDSGILTRDELDLIPLWIYKRLDQRLYQALHNAKKPQKNQ